MEMRSVEVPVKFSGTVTVLVPSHLTTVDGNILANKLALAVVVATVENPDCGECLEAACEEFIDEAAGTEADWDVSKCDSVSGDWHVAD